jgi:hypothetical protein
MEMHQNDHDLLIVLHTEVKNLRSDVKELKDNIVSRVDSLEKNKLEKEDADDIYRDHEDRIRNIERNKPAVFTGSITGGVGGAAALIYAIIQFFQSQ